MISIANISPVITNRMMGTGDSSMGRYPRIYEQVRNVRQHEALKIDGVVWRPTGVPVQPVFGVDVIRLRLFALPLIANVCLPDLQ